MIAWLVFAGYAVGYLAMIHPIYRSLMRHVANENDRYARGPRLDPGEVFWCAAAGSFLALMWPLIVPFMVSHTLYSRGKFKSLEHDAKTVIEAIEEHRLMEKRLKQAAIEVKSVEHEAFENDYFKTVAREKDYYK